MKLSRTRPNIPHLGDQPYDCQVCGLRWRRSQCVKLGKYYHNQGLIVCPNCVDQPDPLMMPFKPRIERTPKNIHDSTGGATTPNASTPIDYSSEDFT